MDGIRPYRMKKGQIGGNIGGTLITLLVLGTLAFVSIKIFGDLSTNLTTGLTGAAETASGNFTAGIWNSIQLLSNVPYLLGALGLLAVVVLFGMYAGAGRIR